MSELTTAQQIARLTLERDQARAELIAGIEIVNAGVAIMSLEQLSRWEGCRGWIEWADQVAEGKMTPEASNV